MVYFAKTIGVPRVVPATFESCSGVLLFFFALKKGRKSNSEATQFMSAKVRHGDNDG